MKKSIISITFILSLSFSSEIQFLEQDICLTDYWNDNRKCVVKYYIDGSEHKLSQRCNKYTFEDDKCTDNSRLAISKNNYNFLMGLMANFLGFMMIFLVGFLYVLQGRR